MTIMMTMMMVMKRESHIIIMMYPTLSENVLACNAATVLYKSMSSRGSMHTGKN